MDAPGALINQKWRFPPRAATDAKCCTLHDTPDTPEFRAWRAGRFQPWAEASFSCSRSFSFGMIHMKYPDQNLN